MQGLNKKGLQLFSTPEIKSDSLASAMHVKLANSSINSSIKICVMSFYNYNSLPYHRLAVAATLAER